jgi:uncharacterized protein (DUF885 family)
MKNRAWACAAAVALWALAAVPLPAQAADAAATRELHQLFDDYWQTVLREYPTYATFVGDTRYNGRLEDLSAAAAQRRRAQQAEFVLRLEAVAPAALDDRDRDSRAVLLFLLRAELRGGRLLGELPLEFGMGASPTPVTQMDGPQFWLPLVVLSTRFATLRDYDDYLQRLAALPAFAAQLQTRLQAGVEAGWMPPRITLRNVPAQFAPLAQADPAANPLYGPFKALPAELPAAQRQRLQQAGAAAIRDAVAPAFARLQTFLRERYLPAGRESLAASALPGGAEYYAAVLELNNTTPLTPREIHDTGLREVARIEAEMEAVQQRAGFSGTRAAFVRRLWTDPRQFAATPAEMLAAYRDIAKRVDPQLPKLFRELPRLPYGVRAMPPEQGDNAEQYVPGALDGSRAGYFEANTNNLHRVARWQMADLLLHEAVPGHHLQTARAQEIRDLPTFRRDIWFPAYGEGWALYAETLGDLIGIYDDPLDKYGQLAAEQWRAARLVVDTGLHALGWSRERAIGYMQEHSAESADEIVAEVDRYIVWPGQATAYKIGQLRIAALRDRARAALGERFDLRAFHNAVLDGGAVPLEVLDEEIGRWVQAQKGAK